MSSKKNKNNKKVLSAVKKGIGERLRQIRKEKGLTQRDTGEMLGINFQHVSKYERAEFIPTFENLIKLIDLFSLNINWLLTGNGPAYLESEKSYPVAEDQPAGYVVKDADEMISEIVSALAKDESLKIKIYRFVKNYLEMKEAAEDLKHLDTR
ncbi:helix-turn-helix domain-containing protein [candidate division KSB1 bacterium]|nr:helix-turn-helix domain-containing protein [candidate division KSB1 bacterium]